MTIKNKIKKKITMSSQTDFIYNYQKMLYDGKKDELNRFFHDKIHNLEFDTLSVFSTIINHQTKRLPVYEKKLILPNLVNIPGFDASNFHYMNSGLVRLPNGRLFGIARFVNYNIKNGSWIINDKKGHFLSLIAGYYITENGDVEENWLYPWSYDLPVSTKATIFGFEDPRIFIFKNRTFVICNTQQASDKRFNQMVLLSLSEDLRKIDRWIFLGITGHDDVFNNSCQKNWSPVVANEDEAFLIYSTQPWVILDLLPAINETKEKKIELLVIANHSIPSLPFPRVRFQTPGLNIGDGFLFMVHTAYYANPQKYVYVSQLVYTNDVLKPEKVSEIFYFNNNGIEICHGWEYNKDKKIVYMMINKDDETCYFSIVDIKIFLQSLKWFPADDSDVKPNKRTIFVNSPIAK